MYNDIGDYMGIIFGKMRFGIGTDIETIDRFRQLDPTKNELFLKKIFTKIRDIIEN